MRLSTKSRYAVTSLLDVAMHSEEGPVSLADISRRQDVSLSYLEQLFSKMRKHGLVNSTRGPGGGYLLSRKPEDIDISTIVMSVDEEIKVINKDALSNGNDFEPCLTEQLWDELSDQISDYLSNISLAEIINQDRDILDELNISKNAST